MDTFLEGIGHITDLDGYDHMLFLLALCACFTYKEWKQVVLLATAFTLGHSITLALAALDLIRFSSSLIEMLIPITIMMTADWNMNAPADQQSSMRARYIITTLFGLIHGMGFSSYFRMMFNETSDIVSHLLLFNLGVEAGQIMIIAVVMLIISILAALKVPRQTIVRVLSLMAFGIALYLLAGKIME